MKLTVWDCVPRATTFRYYSCLFNWHCSKFVWVGSKVGKAFTKNSWKIVKAKVMKCAIKKISLRFMKHTYLKIIFLK